MASVVSTNELLSSLERAIENQEASIGAGSPESLQIPQRLAGSPESLQIPQQLAGSPDER